MSNLSVVVAGVPALASALQSTGKFANVLAAASTTELRQIIPTLKGVSKDEVFFVFGDTLVEDDARFPLSVLVDRLSTGGWQVMIVALSPKADALVRDNPAAGLLPLPLSTNMVLGAMAGRAARGTPGAALEPVTDAHAYENLDLTGRGTSAPAAPAAAAPAPVVPAPAPAAPAPRMGGWSTPAAEPAAPAPVAPAAPAPAPAAPRMGGWSTPAAEPAEAAPANKGWNAPAAEPVPDMNKAGGWNAPAAEPSAPSQAWGAPSSPPVEAAPEAPARRSLAGFGESPAAAPAWASAPVEEAPARRSLSGMGGYEASAPSVESGAGWQPSPNGGPVARPGGYQAEHALATRRGMVITVAVSKGGTGKSSLTLNLATFLALKLRAEGKTVCVIDTNFQQADTGKYLNVFHPNIMAIANDPTLLARERISQALVHKSELNLSALLGPATADDGNPQWITARLYNEILELLREMYDYILIDTPVAEKFHSIFSEFALPKADFIIVPVAPNNATLMNADNWLRSAVTAPRHANGAGVAREKIGIVLNRAKDNIGCNEDDVRANLANWNFLGSIPETDEWQKYNNEFRLVATANYAELSEAFAHVLYAATGEQVLVESFQQSASTGGGLTAKIMGLFKKGNK